MYYTSLEICKSKIIKQSKCLFCNHFLLAQILFCFCRCFCPWFAGDVCEQIFIAANRARQHGPGLSFPQNGIRISSASEIDNRYPAIDDDAIRIRCLKQPFSVFYSQYFFPLTLEVPPTGVSSTGISRSQDKELILDAIKIRHRHRLRNYRL